MWKNTVVSSECAQFTFVFVSLLCSSVLSVLSHVFLQPYVSLTTLFLKSCQAWHPTFKCHRTHPIYLYLSTKHRCVPFHPHILFAYSFINVWPLRWFSRSHESSQMMSDVLCSSLDKLWLRGALLTIQLAKSIVTC